jgi:hypothetical protein
MIVVGELEVDMDTLTAYSMSQMAAKKGAKQMIFDWHKAARLIKEHQPQEASAGLNSDWEYTGGLIWSGKDGPVKKGDTYTYLSSNWATPELDLDGTIHDCYIDSDNNPEGWGSDTLWPQSALDILNG